MVKKTFFLFLIGFTGKKLHNQGGGANYQCLPRNPDWPYGATGGYQSKSYMYGAEYQHEKSPAWSSKVHDNDVPCAVCLVSGRNRQVMIPAKQVCPNGWTREYYGLLVADHHTHRSSTYICLDANMEFVDGGNENKNGGLLYVVEAVCGSLKCPPYKDGFELSCVVCTM